MAAKSPDFVDIDMKEWEVLVPDDVVDLGLFSDELRFSPREDHFTFLSEVLEKKNSDEGHVFKDTGVVPPAIFTGHNAVSVAQVPRVEESPNKSVDDTNMESLTESQPKNNEEEEEGEEYAAEGKKHDKEAACCGVNIWGWTASGGIGALCSIGVAVAIILGGRQQQRRQQQQQQQQHHPNQRLQFQGYTDDTRIKQVMQQATRLNQALSVVRGIPVTRAHISFGGYYDGLLI